MQAGALARFLLFAFGLLLLFFLLRRGFFCPRPSWCRTGLDGSLFRPPLSSRRYAFGRTGRRSHFRRRRFCFLRPSRSPTGLDGSLFRPSLSSRRYALWRTGRRTHFSAWLLSSTSFSGSGLAARRRLIRSSRPAGACNATTGEYARLRCGGNGRTAAVYRRPLPWISPGRPQLLLLCAAERGASLTCLGQLFGRWADGGAAPAAQAGRSAHPDA